MNASSGVQGWCNESRVKCMKNNAWWLCHKYDVNYMIMQWQYDKSKVCHDDNERNGGKLHGNISRNGYGNAIIGRYGGCFEEDIGRFMCERAYHITGFGCTGEVCTNSQCEKGQCTVLKRLANGGKVKVRIIHGLNISQKNSYTYCKNLEVIKNQVLRACS